MTAPNVKGDLPFGPIGTLVWSGFSMNPYPRPVRGLRRPNPAHRPLRIPSWLALSAWALFLGALAEVPQATAAEDTTFRTATASFSVDEHGVLTGIQDLASGRNYLAPGQPAPLLSLRRSGRVHAPTRAAWEAASRQLTLRFDEAEGSVAVLRVDTFPSHVAFEVLRLEPSTNLDWILWGPYPTTISETIGETVGVVRNADFAIGIQALVPRTLGGYPHSENDAEGESSDDDRGLYADLPPELSKGQHYRGDTARRTAFGSVLQAYARTRDQERIVANWGHERYQVPTFPDGGGVGSRIALFACPTADALPTLGTIEQTEGLPHPMIDGVWGKMSPGATASYLIVDFSEATVDRAIEMTRRAGLRYLYHSSPFETWGHFRLKPSLFPRGWDGLKACAEQARRAGVRLGVHTLSNFITPNDPYVSPRPDPRLARVGSSTLAAGIDEATREIPVADPGYFLKASAMNTVAVGEELIRFSTVSKEAPWRLLDCQRGAWGTRAASHAPGDAVGRLLDHEYKVFLSDPGLSIEIARNLAGLFDHAGLFQLSFDGLEGNWSTGFGKYGCTLFTKAWFDALAPELRGQVINDASLPGHYSWHIHTRMNWGEPWYGGFRESQTLYRFKNQVYFERNYMPHMLGWFALRPDTSLEDAEWLLARAAGFDAGFTLATSLASTAQLEADPLSAETARRFGATTAILEAIRQWETARMARAFPPAVRTALRDNQREFQLRSAGPGLWDLREAHLRRFTVAATQTSADFSFPNPAAAQPLRWILRSTAKNPVSGLSITVNEKPVLQPVSVSLPPGGSLRYDGGPQMVVADAAWKEVARVDVDTEAVRISEGPQRLTLGWEPQPDATLKWEVRTFGPDTRLSGSSGPATRP